MNPPSDQIALALKARTRLEMAQTLEPCRPSMTVMDVRRLTERLRSFSDADEPLEPLRIAFVRTYTTELLRPYLVFESLLHGFDLDLHEAPYGAVHVEAQPGSGTATHQPHILYLFLRLEDLDPGFGSPVALLPAAQQRELADAAVARLDGILRDFRQVASELVVVTLLPKLSGPSLGAYDAMAEGSETRFRWSLKERIVTELRASFPEVVLEDLDLLLEELGRQHLFDLRLWYGSRYPFSAEGSAALARRLMRFPMLLRRPPAKCIVVDADNTLWGGVVGEDGIDKIALGPEHPGSCYLAFQQRLLEFHARGVLLALCSKNEAGDVLEVLRSHPHALLREEHFAAMQINWRPKADNVRDIARDLNLGVDALVVVDDSPHELLLLRQQIPELTLVQVPKALPTIPSCLDDLPRLQLVRLTEEDRLRSQLYEQERSRRHLAASGSLEEYLTSLQMVMAIGVDDESQVARIAQLTQKTNQFNLTTRRYSEAQILQFMRDQDSMVVHFSLADVFGNAGLVGVAILRDLTADVARVDSFLMSCRVIGRTVETAFLEQVLRLVASGGVSRLRAEYVPTSKSGLVRTFWADHGFQQVDSNQYETALMDSAPLRTPWVTVRLPPNICAGSRPRAVRS